LKFLQVARPEYQHPFHWNNFVVVGDIQPFEIIVPWYKSYYFYIALVFLILAITFKVRRNLSSR
ncbi:MAG: hypothetical protein WBA74_03145, partial [Cyclobacteriaceae bacterium]